MGASLPRRFRTKSSVARVVIAFWRLSCCPMSFDNSFATLSSSVCSLAQSSPLASLIFLVEAPLRSSISPVSPRCCRHLVGASCLPCRSLEELGVVGTPPFAFDRGHAGTPPRPLAHNLPFVVCKCAFLGTTPRRFAPSANAPVLIVSLAVAKGSCPLSTPLPTKIPPHEKKRARCEQGEPQPPPLSWTAAAD